MHSAPGWPPRWGGVVPSFHLLPSPAWCPQSLRVGTEWMGWECGGAEDVFIKGIKQFMAKYVLEVLMTGKKRKKVTHSSTKHKKFLGVSGKGRRVDLKVFIE